MPAEGKDEPLSLSQNVGLWDEEVLALEKQVRDKLQQAEEWREKLEVAKAKKSRRSTYIQTLRQQSRNLENVRNARTEEVEALQRQEDLRRLETAHVQMEYGRAKQLAHTLVSRCSRDENTINRLKEEISNLQTDAELDRDLINTCLDYSERHQMEYALLEQYLKEDEVKIKDCMFRIDVMTADEQKEKNELDEIENQLRALRIEQRRIMDQHKYSMAELQQKLSLWSKIRSQIVSADRSLEQLEKERSDLQAKSAAQKETLGYQKTFFADEDNNNKELHLSVQLLEMKVAKAARTLSGLQTQRTEIIDQIKILENTCETQRRLIWDTRMEHRKLNSQLDFVQRSIAKTVAVREDTICQHEDVDKKNLTDEERVAEMNKNLNESTAAIRTAEQQFNVLRDSGYKRVKENSALQNELELTRVQVTGSQQQLNTAKQQIKNALQLSRAQARQAYELDYRISQLVRRITHMEGGDTGPSEKLVLELKDLTQKRDELTAEISLMQSRVQKQQETIKNLKKDCDGWEQKRHKFDISLAETLLLLSTAEKTLTAAKNRKIDIVAELSSSRLKLTYITDKAESQLDSVTSLSMRKAEMDGLFKERVVRIQIEREGLRAQQKRIEEQKGFFVKLLRDLEYQQKGVKSRFDLLALPVPDSGQGDATDIVQVQAQFFVKAALEKQQINENKERLMREIQGIMENNYKLRVFLEQFEEESNKMRTTVYDVSEKAELDRKRSKLDYEITTLKQQLRSHENQIFTYKEELALLEKTTEKLDTLKDKVAQGIKQESEEVRMLTNDCADQKQRLERTTKQNTAMLATLKKSIASEDLDTFLEETKATVHAEAEKVLLQTLRRCVEKEAEALNVIDFLFQKANITLSDDLMIMLRSSPGLNSLPGTPHSRKGRLSQNSSY